MPKFAADFDHFGEERPASSGPFSPAVCFIIGLTVLLPIAPETRLTLFDLMAPMLILFQWRVASRQFKGLAALLAVSLLAMVVSAQVNASGLIELLSRSYPMITLTIEIMGYYVVLRGSGDRGKAALVLGTMAGICFHYFYPNDLRILEDSIKFLLGIPIGVAILAFGPLVTPRDSNHVLLGAAFMLSYAVFCFMVGARSIGGVYAVSAILLVGLQYVKVPKNYSRFAPLMIGVSVVATYALTEFYTYLAIQGLFGDRAAGIALFQSSFGSILIGGRPEIVINLRGMWDSPLLGVGIVNYPSIYIYEMINLAVYSRNDVFQVDNILYHSALFATAFESGIIAASFWAVLAYRAIFAVPLLSDWNGKTRAFVAPLLIMTVWHIIYSPPIPYNRFVMAIGLAFVWLIRDQWRESQAR